MFQAEGKSHVEVREDGVLRVLRGDQVKGSRLGQGRREFQSGSVQVYVSERGDMAAHCLWKKASVPYCSPLDPSRSGPRNLPSALCPLHTSVPLTV